MTFLTALVVGLLIVWLRPPAYESTAILHFSYPQPLDAELAAVADEQIGVHAQRLLGNQILAQVQSRLEPDSSLSIEALADMLRAKAVPASQQT